MPTSTFAIRHDRWYAPIARITALPPRRSTVTLDASVVRVRMGWAFRAEIPIASITDAAPDRRPVSGWGVHGFSGRWLVNGSSQGIIALRIDPPVCCRMTGLPLRLRELRVSLDRPEEFLDALAGLGVTVTRNRTG
ncbi:hypothetical protein ACIRBX_25560 [Kitasatospora sp. NPDC096147]|uniref:hypothetical protein n=1 Tax=Kitasatospora sp. NPDC096147 TaxID=3364093 RepID=UPI0038106C00